MKPFNTIADLVRYIGNNHSDPHALNCRVESKWEHTSTETFLEQVRYLALGLKNLGIKKGDMIGILSESSPQWTIADLAIMGIGAVSVPLFANISDENFEFEIQQTNLKYIFVAGKEQWAMYSRHKKNFEVVIKLCDSEDSKEALRFQDVLAQGKVLDDKEPELYDTLHAGIKSDDLASIVYTSGSTGFPKGVMLSHNNLAGLLYINPITWDKKRDAYLSILPLAHIFARVINLVTIAWGIRVFYLNDLTKISVACKEIHPTFAIFVPRIIEKIYAKILYSIERESPIKKMIAKWAFNLAISENNSWYMKLLMVVADKLVYRHLRDSLGGNFRFAVSGGASLNPLLQRFFLNIGFPLYEGWGLTEAATVCCCPREKVTIGTVGVPFEGMEIKISNEGEILVKGPLVMQGYYKNEEETKKAFTDDGWLRTGDKGIINENGYLIIQGRLKELYKTSTGEYIAPVPIEQELCKTPLIDMAMVIGEGHKYAACLLFPDYEVVRALKKSYKMEHMSDDEFLNSVRVKREIKRHIETVNKHLNHWEEMRAFRIIPVTPSIEGGELTPTMKIRRDVLLKKYRPLIDSIYVEEDA